MRKTNKTDKWLNTATPSAKTRLTRTFDKGKHIRRLTSASVDYSRILKLI